VSTAFRGRHLLACAASAGLLGACFGDGDALRLGPERADVLADVQTEMGCRKDEHCAGSGFLRIPNLLPSDGTCPNELVIFRAGHGMEVVSAKEHVGSSAGDVIPADRRPGLRYDHLKVWVPVLDEELEDDLAREWRKDALARAHADVARAHNLFNTSRCGIAFTSEIEKKEVSDVELFYQVCDTTAQLKNSVGYDDNAVNVYYVVDVDDGLRGVFCPDTSVLLVGKPSDNETLAHEIGHAFSLNHFSSESGGANVMTDGSYTRTGATLGQCFRSNFDGRSMLLRNQRGPHRQCHDYEGNDACPDVTWPVTMRSVAPAQPPPTSGAGALRRWLECEECAAGELQAFVNAPLNEQEVRQAWSNELTGQERHLDRTYTELRRYGPLYQEVPAIAMSRKEYIQRYKRSALYRHQLRLSMGLRLKRTLPATRLFDELIEDALPEVKVTVGKLLM
jgi:hypothetical protein